MLQSEIKSDFPTLNQKINGNDLVYLDNAATTQKPNSVINSVSEYYKKNNSNIHRGVHTLSQEATEKYENALPLSGWYFGSCITIKDTTSFLTSSNG